MRSRHIIFRNSTRHADRRDGPGAAGGSSYTLFSYEYNAKDELTTITNADSDVTVNEFSTPARSPKRPIRMRWKRLIRTTR